MADIFNQTVRQATGLYSGDYLWSAMGNWSTGAPPLSSDAVTLNLSPTYASMVDNTFSVASLTFNSSGSLQIGGSLTTGSVGVVSGMTGESMSVLSGGSLHVTGTLNLAAGVLDIAGSATIGSLALNSGATLAVEGNATVGQIGGGSIAINKGGTLEITTLLSSIDAFTLNGGSLKIDSGVILNGSTSFTFGSPAAYGVARLNLADIASNIKGYAFSNTISLFAIGDSIELGTATFSNVSYSGHTLLLSNTNGSPGYTLSNFNIVSSITNPLFTLSTAADGGTVATLNCFLTGTRIETADGPVPIEALSVGDLVVTIERGSRVLKPVRWIGTREVDRVGMDEDAARDAAPVRIRAHASADNVPVRDLLVTADHGVFEAGGLIPARMLVNGTSILRESERLRYGVHHLEFATHSILLSEGLTTESYLDTGGRAGFGLPDAHAPRAATWAEDAAAPLLTARGDVEPIWHRLAQRAEALGMGPPDLGIAVRTTQDPAARLVLAGGSLLRARRCRGDRHFFVLPAASRHVTLRSRSAIPAEIEGPFVDDRRRLGLCVRGIRLWTDLRSTVVPFDSEGLRGWHRAEAPGGCRWTGGEGELELPMLSHATVLEIELTGLRHYASVEDRPQRLRA